MLPRGGEILILLFLLPLAALYVFVLWRLVAKTGNHGALALLFLVPLANIGLALYLAFTEWPIEQEVKRLRADRS
jgi:hypothetical protein